MRLEKMRSKKFLAFACLAFAGFCGCSSDSSSNAPVVGTPLTDSRDGQTYRTVDIGGQIWMAQNLDYAAEGSYCYGDAEAYCALYGRLYTWATAKVACPDGWHLPSSDEFNALLSSVGAGAGKSLKAVFDWDLTGNGSDAVGFSAFPAGYYSNGDFSGIKRTAFFWSADDNAYALELSINSVATLSKNDKGKAFSVRCVQN